MPKDINVRLDDKIYTLIKQDSQADHRSMSGFIHRVIEAHFAIPLTSKKPGKVKAPPPFKSGDMVTISARDGVFKVMAIDGLYAMVRRPGCIPFVTQVKGLKAIEQEAK